MSSHAARSKKSPTARSKEWIRDNWPGVDADVVERRIPVTAPKDAAPGKFRPSVLKDLFGFIDIVAMGDASLLGIQATAKSGMSARLAKMRDEEHLPKARRWLRHARLEIWGWSKVGRLWQLRRKRVFVDGDGLGWEEL